MIFGFSGTKRTVVIERCPSREVRLYIMVHVDVSRLLRITNKLFYYLFTLLPAKGL